MNFNVTEHVKNRIETAQNTNITESALNVAESTKDKAVEMATGLPVQAAKTFHNVFSEALASMAHYMSMTFRAYGNGFVSYQQSYTRIADAIRANNAAEAFKAMQDAGAHMFNGAVELAIADQLSYPLSQAIHAGFNLVTGTVGLSALADVAVPLLVVIALGYASLKLRDLTAEKMKGMVEGALEGVRSKAEGVQTTLDEVEVVDVDSEEELNEVLDSISSNGATDEEVAEAVEREAAGLVSEIESEEATA